MSNLVRPLTRSVTRALTTGVVAPVLGGFSPATLFAANEQGAWYDPSDLSTMFQDANGTTPVTAVEQPVGRIHDKSLRLQLGPERLTNGTFANGTTGWTAAGGATLGSAPDGLTVTGSANARVEQSLIPTTVGRTYMVEVSVTLGAGVTVAQLNFCKQSDGSPTHDLELPVSGTHRFYPSAVEANSIIKLRLKTGTGTVTFHRVTMRELPGNHATQSTAASRPVLRQDAGGRYYLAFDGVDDWLQTGNINFTATDKMTVFAGVRKDSDAAVGLVAELSSNAGVNDAFALLAPAGATPSYGIRLNAGGYNATTFTAPHTGLLAAQFDRAGALQSDEQKLRVNGAAASLAESFSATTTGNFGNFPLYIGRRGGTSLPFNGRIFGLVIRGAASTADQIASTERFLAARTGVTLP